MSTNLSRDDLFDPELEKAMSEAKEREQKQAHVLSCTVSSLYGTYGGEYVSDNELCITPVTRVNKLNHLASVGFRFLYPEFQHMGDLQISATEYNQYSSVGMLIGQYMELKEKFAKTEASLMHMMSKTDEKIQMILDKMDQQQDVIDGSKKGKKRKMEDEPEVVMKEVKAVYEIKPIQHLKAVEEIKVGKDVCYAHDVKLQLSLMKKSYDHDNYPTDITPNLSTYSITLPVNHVVTIEVVHKKWFSAQNIFQYVLAGNDDKYDLAQLCRGMQISLLIKTIEGRSYLLLSRDQVMKLANKYLNNKLEVYVSKRKSTIYQYQNFFWLTFLCHISKLD